MRANILIKFEQRFLLLQRIKTSVSRDTDRTESGSHTRLDALNPDTDLGRWGREVLLAIKAQGGTATSREIVDTIERDIGENGTTVVNYNAKEYLEAEGLVTGQTAAESRKPGSIPPREYHLTDRGRELIRQMDDRDMTPTVGVDDLEETISRLKTRIDTLEDQSGSGVNQDALAGVQSDVATLEQQVEAIEQAPILSDEDVRKAIDAGTIWASVCKDLLIEEYGRDELERRFKERQREIPLILTAQRD